MKKIVLLLYAIIPGMAATTYCQDMNTQSWFPFQPVAASPAAITNLTTWLDKPAGKYGPVLMQGDALRFANGKQIKFWGVNIASESPFVDAEKARRWTAFMASFGINAVRFHKFTWEATDGIWSTQLTDQSWKNFDYFNNELKIAGIYTTWSHIYGHRVLPADSARLLAYSEVANSKFPWSHLNGSTAAIVNFAEDLQDLNIELTVNMLNHKNPHTGLRYADEPALACIEFQNEDNIFWAAIEATLKQTPTYRKLLCKKFSSWLQKKYASTANLRQAWAGALPDSQSIEQQNIYPQPNHGFFSGESARLQNTEQALPQHVTDKALFLYDEQNKFYTRFVAAVRKTGYGGLIVASCWQAGSGVAHLLNLLADYNAGVIDRHNYSGGSTGHSLVPGKVNPAAMVQAPGSGLLSTGFQQVIDRPFFLSEWMSLIPNQFTVEAAPIVALYGMGLQGWDGSFAFAMDYDRFTPTVQSHGVYNTTSPTHLALYPALARAILRNDVQAAPIVAERRVSLSLLQKGRLPPLETVEQEADVKNLRSLVPLSTLAKGRVVIRFDSSVQPYTTPVQKTDGTTSVRSTTNQLQWQPGDSGWFSVNTKGTAGLVGFAKNKKLENDVFSLTMQSPFAVVLVSAAEQNKTLQQSKRWLITTVGRARNTGMEYSADGLELLKVGTAPILLEPVVTALQLKCKDPAVLYALDHGGNRTGVTIVQNRGKFLLDGARYKTLYYELAFE